MILKELDKKLLPTIFLLFLFSIGTYLYLSPDQQKSYVEKRTLKQSPELTAESILNGDFVKDYEKYFTDQFPGRNIFLKSYVNFQQLTGKTFINGYYVSKDGWIMPEPTQRYSKDAINKATKNLNEFARFAHNKGMDVYFFDLPHKANIVEVDMPSYIEKSIGLEKKEYFLSKVSYEYIKVVDIAEKFKEKYTQEEIKNMYFKTDHHWNALGAFNGYTIIKDTLKEEVYYNEVNKEYITMSVNKPFSGSYNRQIYEIVDLRTDKPFLIQPKDNEFKDFKVSVNGKKSSYRDVYASRLNKEGKLIYGDLFTGDLRKISITNPYQTKGNILVVKGSYGSPIVFDIAQHFHKTTFVDIRHSKNQSVMDLITENQFDAVLFLYSDNIVYGSMYEFKKTPKS